MLKRLTLLLVFCCATLLATAQLVDVITGVSFPWALAIKGNDLYIGLDGTGSVIKIDITQQSPVPVNVVTGLGFEGVGGLAIQGNFLYYANYNTKQVKKIDITQPNPTPVDVFTAAGLPFSITINGNYLYIAENGSKIQKIDLSPAQPTLVTTYTGTQALGMAIKDNFLYFSDDASKVYKIDESQPTPTIVEVVTGLYEPAGLTLNGNFLYIAENDQISKIDLNAATPVPVTVVSGLNTSRLTAFNGLDMFITEYVGNKVSKLTIGQPEFSTQPPVCAGTMPGNLGGASPAGGVYSGTGVTNNGNGETYTFDAISQGVGTYTVTYTLTNGSTATVSIQVVPPPVATFTPPASVALGAGLQSLNGLPAGGVYTGPGITGTNFDPAVAGPGTHTLTYTYTDGNGCSASATGTVTVTPNTPADNACGGATNINSLFGGAQGSPVVSTLYDNTPYNSMGDPATGFECFYNGDGLQHTVWYTFTGDGKVYKIRSVQCNAANYIPDGDTQAAIYTGGCGSLTPVACTEDEDPANNILNINTTFVAQQGVTYYMLVDGYAGRTGQFCLEVTNLGVSGVTEIAASNIRLFPNPTTGLVRISEGTAERIQVIDQLGRVVMVQNTPSQQIDMSALPSGAYSLLLDMGKEGQVSARVVLK